MPNHQTSVPQRQSGSESDQHTVIHIPTDGLHPRHRLGFLASGKRFNVAATRAQALFIVVGNPRVLGGDPNWGRLLAYCVDGGSYVGAALPSGWREGWQDGWKEPKMLQEEEALIKGWFRLVGCGRLHLFLVLSIRVLAGLLAVVLLSVGISQVCCGNDPG